LLSELITEVMTVLEELEISDYSSNQCNNKLKSIKTNIGDADIPELVKQREREITEFSSKLRKAETDFSELKKII
jgi:hypothetical protein